MKVVATSHARQVSSYQSNYLYGVEKRQLFRPEPPERDFSPRQTTYRQEKIYEYRQIEGWQGELPVSFTYLTARQVYTTTKELFASDWRVAPKNGRIWVA